MEEVLTLDITTWTLVLSVVLPLLVGIVTKQVAHPGLKATFLALFAAATGAVNSAIADQGILTKETLTAAVVSFVIAVATYYGFWKPTTVSTKVQDATANLGVG